MKFNQLSALALILFLGLETKAQALTLYDNKAAFLSATGATSATGPLPNLGALGTGTATVGDVTFSIAPPSSNLIFGSLDWTPFMSGNEIAISHMENLNVDLVSPVYALGFDFVEPIETNCFIADCYDSTFGVTLLNNNQVIDTFTFNAPNDVLAFIGFSSNLKFNRVEIRDLTGTIDDEFFGEFYTAVPEPLTLLGAGTAISFGAAFKRKLRQK